MRQRPHRAPGSREGLPREILCALQMPVSLRKVMSKLILDCLELKDDRTEALSEGVVDIRGDVTTLSSDRFFPQQAFSLPLPGQVCHQDDCSTYSPPYGDWSRTEQDAPGEAAGLNQLALSLPGDLSVQSSCRRPVLGWNALTVDVEQIAPDAWR